MRFVLTQLVCCSFIFAACGPPPPSGSGRSNRSVDAGQPERLDAGDQQLNDAGVQQSRDAGSVNPPDAGRPPVDAGRPPVQNGCLENGNGRTTGSQLSNFRLQNCNGDWVELHDNCGRTKVQVVMLVTEWCPNCQTAMSNYTEVAQSVGRDWHNLFVLGELRQNQPATLSECSRVAREKGVDPSLMLVDPSFTRTLRGGWVVPCTENDRFGLPQTNILDAQSMTLRWESMCDGRIGEVDPNTIIREILGR